MRRLLILLVFGLSASAVTAGPVRYVSDELVITMRAGKGNQYQIIQSLPSGVRLEVLEEAEKFVRVRSPKGKEGWVRSQYLIAQPIAKHRLAAAEEKLETARDRYRALQEKFNTLRENNREVRSERSRLEKEKNGVAKELEELRQLATRPAQLHAENQKMRKRIATLEGELNRLTKANSALEDRSQRDWFLTGAGVLGGGILLGLILPLLRRRRKSSDFDLR